MLIIPEINYFTDTHKKMRQKLIVEIDLYQYATNKYPTILILPVLLRNLFNLS